MRSALQSSLRSAGCIVACVLGPVSAPTLAGEYTETATRHLMQSVQMQPDGSHLARLSSLRLLQDPDMKDMFYRLLQHDDWHVQVHALLGLAEIDDAQQLDPWLVTQVAPLAREQAIAHAIDMDMLNGDGMRKILEWDRLESTNQLLLMAELQRAGSTEMVDEEVLRNLANDNDLAVAAIASLLLARDDLAPLSAVNARLAGASPSERLSVLRRMIEVIRIYKLDAAASWLDDVLQDEPSDDILYWGTYTLMTIAPDRARPHWNRMLGPTPSYRNRIMGALQFLEAGQTPDADARARLNAEDDPLIMQILETAALQAEGRPISKNIKGLIDTGHPRVIDWAMRTARELPPDQASSVYGHFIDLPETTRRRSQEITQRSHAISAMATLLEISPDEAIDRLRAAEDDSMQQQTLLMGSMQSQHPRLAETVSQIRRIGSSRADSLALLLLARTNENLTPKDLQQLGRISAGGGQLNNTLQIQAAWLYLKHTDGLQTAMVRLAPEN